MPHILIAESLHRSTLDHLAKEHQVILQEGVLEEREENSALCFYYQPDITPEQLEKEIHKYDGLVVRPKPVSTKAIAQAENLKVIIRGGAGVNAIDCQAAHTKNIIVENTPGKNSIATAEFAFAAMMQLVARRPIDRAHAEVMNASKKKLLALEPGAYCANELHGKSLAIIGLGNVGQAMVLRAKAFGMKVKAYSGSFAEGRVDKRALALGVDQVLSLQEACADVDVISLHIPLTKETDGIINQKIFDVMKQGVVIINTARPQLIDSKACDRAMSNLGGLAVDGDPDVLLSYVGIAKSYPDIPTLMTHHIADCTDEAQANITQQIIHQLVAYFQRGEVINAVNV